MASDVRQLWDGSTISRHLGFYRTAKSAVRSADLENPISLEPNMEWIGWTVCEIFAFKLYGDIEIGVRGHSRSSRAALFDRAHTTSCSSSIVNMHLSITVSEPHIGRKTLPHCIWRTRWGWSHQIYAVTLGDEKLEWWAYQTVKEFLWYVQPFWHKARVCDRRTDRQRDGRNWRGIEAL